MFPSEGAGARMATAWEAAAMIAPRGPRSYAAGGTGEGSLEAPSAAAAARC
jgi:hypothetical protein